MDVVDEPQMKGVRRRWSTRPSAWLEWGLIVAVFFVVGGAPTPHVNEPHYLGKAKHYWDATYCPEDMFLDSADAHLTFYWTFGWVTQLVPLPAAAWIGRIAAWALLAFAWQRLSRAVAAAPWASVLSAAMWTAMIEYGNFAGEWVVGGVEAKCFAYVLVLLGLAALARGRWRAIWILLGAAAAFHVLVGAWAVLTAGCVWLTEPAGKRASLRRMAPALVLGGVLSLPGLLPALALQRGADPAVVEEAARIYVFDRLPHHLAPLSLPAEELRRRLVRFGVVAAACLALWAWASREARENSAAGEAGASSDQWSGLLRLMRFAGFALAANCAGLLLEAALADRPLTAARWLRYYWFRQADVVVPLAAALAGARLVVVLATRSGGRAVAAWAAVAGCAWFIGSTAIGRLVDPVPPALLRVDRPEEWRQACQWVRANTPDESLFLIPRGGYTFKWYAARADVANYKDVPQDADGVVRWRRRCEALFPLVEVNGQVVMQSSPEQWGASRVRALAREYGASHIIARSYPPMDLPVAYPDSPENAESYYTVYETGVAPAALAP